MSYENYTCTVYMDEVGEWRWRVKAANGNDVADSGEGYKNHDDCLEMVNNLFGGIEIVDEKPSPPAGD